MAQAPTVAMPKRLPLVVEPENRDDTTLKDARLVNCYTEKSKDGTYNIYKRAGTLTQSQPSGGAANGYGVYNWKNDIYSIFGATMYKNGTPLSGTLDTTGGVYRFNQILGSTNKMFFDNGVKAYNYDPSGGIVQVTDVNLITNRVKGSAYLDASTYVMNNTATIQASALNDTTSFPALNTLIAQIEPDGGVALAKQLVYVIAMKQWSTEVFYDAANATGSPLGAVQGAKVNFGCVNADSVQDIDGTLFWIATNRSAAPQVMAMDNLKAEIVSTKPIDRLLDELDFTNVFSWQFKDEGHKFYIVTIKNSNLTLAYDLTEKMWHQWTDTNGNYFPVVASTYTSTLQHIWQHETNGKLYYGDRDYTNDDGNVIQCDIYTPNFDGGTKRRKQMEALEFIADKQAGSTLMVRVNDYDYDPSKWTNFRAVDLSKNQPRLTNCGTFTRRAHNLRHRSNTTMRLQAIELQLDIGTL